MTELFAQKYLRWLNKYFHWYFSKKKRPYVSGIDQKLTFFLLEPLIQNCWKQSRARLQNDHNRIESDVFSQCGADPSSVSHCLDSLEGHFYVMSFPKALVDIVFKGQVKNMAFFGTAPVSDPPPPLL